MNLLIVAALVAVCGAAKLDRTYLPPASARTAGGSPGSLQTPNSFPQNAAPKGSFTNEFQGVVVDAALAGTRGASGSEETGLGAPRNSYGSTASKVGDAAFRSGQAGFRFPQGFAPNSHASQDSDQFEARETDQGFEVGSQGIDSRHERPQAAQERAANTLRFDSEVGVENFNYAFETDNGISAEETGTAINGVQAQGGYSYTGDDGKVYTVTYTADEGGYQPRGDHLPTPPPIPEEILKSLEQNARDEANGVIDDGLYDAQKYNAGSDYAESDSVNGKQNDRPSANTGNTDVDASGTFINQNIQKQPFNPNNRDKTVNQFSSHNFGSTNEYLPPFQQQNQRPAQANADNPDADSSSFPRESGSGDFHSRSKQQSRPSQSFGSRGNANQFNSNKQNNNGQVNLNGNRFASQSNSQQFGSANTAPQNGHNQFSAHASASFNSQHATSIPDTELTTPLESSPQDAQSAQTSASSTQLGFNAQPSHNGQSQFGAQNSHTSQAPVKPTIPSFPQSRPQGPSNRPFGGNKNTQSAFSTISTQAPRQQEHFIQQSAFGSKRPQLSQNQFSQNPDNQFSPSTQRPQFAQQSTAQDDSYYYNQPSRVFNTPQSQGSRFSSASSNQFDRVTQKPFSSQTTEEEENYPSTVFPSLNGQRPGLSRRPSYPTQSAPSGNQFQSNSIASTSNGITQASASSFAAPTSAPSFNNQQSNFRQQLQQSPFQPSRSSSPEPSKPSFSAQTTSQTQTNRPHSNQFEKQNFDSAKPLSQQPLQDVKQVKLDDDTKPDAPVTNLQYTGEVYEYTKPAEMLPPPEDGFGQFGTKVSSSQKQSQPRPQVGQVSAQASSQTFTPQPTQFSQSTKTQQSNQFGSRPQFGQSTSSAQVTSKPFASQSSQFSQSSSQSNQFGSRPQFGQSSASALQTASGSFAPEPTQFSQSSSQSNQHGSRPQFGQASAQQTTSGPFAPDSTQFSQSSSQHRSRPQVGQSTASVQQTQFSQTSSQGSQFGSRPQFPTASSQKPTQFSQNTNNQQSTQFGTRPQFGQSASQQTFGSKPQYSQASQDQFSAQTQEQTNEFDAKPAQQFNQAQTEQHSQYNNQRRPAQGSLAASDTTKPFGQNGCCNGSFGQQSSFGSPSQDSSISSSFQSSGFKPAQSQSVAGKGEVFGGARAPPSFDETGYHY